MDKIVALLVQSLKDGKFNLPLAQSNVLYDATADENRIENDDGTYTFKPFLEIVGVSGNIQPHTLSGNIDRVDGGTFRVNLRYTSNSGADEIQRKAGEITSYYCPRREFKNEGAQVIITNVAQGFGTPDFGWFKLELTINFIAFQRR